MTKLRSILGLLVLSLAAFSAQAQIQTVPVTPDLPQFILDTTYTLPTGGCTWSPGASFVACSGGAGQYIATTVTGLQQVLDSYTPGDVIIVPSGSSVSFPSTAGSGTLCQPGSETGDLRSASWVWPYKNNPSGKWTYMIASDFYNGVAGAPTVGNRLDPENNPTQSAHVYKIHNGSVAAAFCFPNGVSKIRIIGVEFDCINAVVNPTMPEATGSCSAFLGSVGVGGTGNRWLKVTQTGGRILLNGSMFQVDSWQPRCNLTPTTIPGDGLPHTVTGHCQNMNLTHAVGSPYALIGINDFQQEAPDIYYGNASSTTYTITGCSVANNVATINLSGSSRVYGNNTYVSGLSGACSFLNGVRSILGTAVGSFNTYASHANFTTTSDSGTVAEQGLYGNVTVVDDNTFTLSVTPNVCDTGNTTNHAESFSCLVGHYVQVFAKLPAGVGECHLSSCTAQAYDYGVLDVSGNPEQIVAVCADNVANTVTPNGGHLCDVVNSPVVVTGLGFNTPFKYNIVGTGTHWATTGYTTIVATGARISGTFSCDTDTHCLYSGIVTQGYSGSRTVNVTTFPTTLTLAKIHLSGQVMNLKSFLALKVLPCQTTSNATGCAIASQSNCYIQAYMPDGSPAHGQTGTTTTVAVVQAESTPGASNCTMFQSTDVFDFEQAVSGSTQGPVTPNAAQGGAIVTSSKVVGGPVCQGLGYPSGGGYCADVTLAIGPKVEVGATEIILDRVYMHGDAGTIKNCSYPDGTIKNDPNGTSPSLMTCQNRTGATQVVTGANGRQQVVPDGTFFTMNTRATQRGAYWQGSNSAFIDSTIAELSVAGAETQGIVWNQSIGGNKVCNTRIDNTTENMFAGGGYSPMARSIGVSQDIIIGNGSYGLSPYGVNLDASCKGNYFQKRPYYMPLSGPMHNMGTPVTVTSMQLTSNVITVTANNTFKSPIGTGCISPPSANCTWVTLTGIATTDPFYPINSFPTAQTRFSVLSATPTTFTIAYTHADIPLTAETTVSAYPFMQPVTVVKNLWEQKTMDRELVDGNVFDTVWYGGQWYVGSTTQRVGASQGNLATRSSNLTYSNNVGWNGPAGIATFAFDDFCYPNYVYANAQNTNGTDCGNGIGVGGFSNNIKVSNVLMSMIEHTRNTYPPTGGFLNGDAGYKGGIASGGVYGFVSMVDFSSGIFVNHVTQIMNSNAGVSSVPQSAMYVNTQREVATTGSPFLGCQIGDNTAGTYNYTVWDSVFNAAPSTACAYGTGGGAQFQWQAMLYPRIPACSGNSGKDAASRFAGNVLYQNSYTFPGCGIYINTTFSAPMNMTTNLTTPAYAQAGLLTSNAVSPGVPWNGNATWNGSATTHDGNKPGVYIPTLNAATANVFTGQQSCVASPPVITTTALTAGAVGESYSATLSATCGQTPYTNWTIVTGSLPNLTLNSSTGVISGTPNASGTFSISVTVQDSTAQTSAPVNLTLLINQELFITTTLLPPGSVGVSYATTINGVGGLSPYTWSVASGSMTVCPTLTNGLCLSAASGTITGTPVAAGTLNFTVRLTDAGSATVTSPLFITIAGIPSITTASLPNGAVGETYSQVISASGGTPPYSWSILSGSMTTCPTLTNGLCMTSSSTTASITGTPVTATASSFTIKVTDAATKTATQALTVTANPALSISTTTLPTGAMGSSYSSTLIGAGGITPYSWTRSSGTLPTGLTLSSAGVIFGTPTVSGVYNFVVRLTDAGTSITQPLAITITSALFVATSSLPDGLFNTPYSQTVVASGGLQPYTWTQTAGTMCVGLSLGTDGVISGTPTSVQTCSFTVTVTDMLGAHANAPLSITIQPLVLPLTVTTTTLPYGTVSVNYSQSLIATGGVLPYSWRIISGALPPGLSIVGSFITGQPTQVGTFTFTPQVTDSVGTNASSAAPISITIKAMAGTTFVPSVIITPKVVVK